MNDTTDLLPHVKLRLHIDYPNYEECYSFGYECASSGMAEEDNPFAEGTQKHDQWNEGWWAGFYNEEPIFKESEDLSEKEFAGDMSAANEQVYHPQYMNFITQVLKITGAITATALIGYQIFELVA